MPSGIKLGYFLVSVTKSVSDIKMVLLGQVVSHLGSFLLSVTKSVSDVSRFYLCQVKFSAVGHLVSIRCYRVLFVPGRVF